MWHKVQHGTAWSGATGLYLHHLLPAFNIQQARETAVAGFLIQCDSSRMTRRHSYERRPGPFKPDLFFEARSSPWIVPSGAKQNGSSETIVYIYHHTKHTHILTSRYNNVYSLERLGMNATFRRFSVVHEVLQISLGDYLFFPLQY